MLRDEERGAPHVTSHGIDWDRVTHPAKPVDEQAEQGDSDHFEAWQAQSDLASSEWDNREQRLGRLYTPPSRREQKVTIYLNDDLVRVIKALKKNQKIPSYSWLVEEALKAYLLAMSV
jgi:hypothetical protein